MNLIKHATAGPDVTVWHHFIIFSGHACALFVQQDPRILFTEPKFVILLRSPGIDSQPGEIDSLKSIPGLLIRLQIRAHEFAEGPQASIPQNRFLVRIYSELILGRGPANEVDSALKSNI
jgi:hypothetical protein